MDNKKHIHNLEIGDMVTFSNDVWFITKITKTQYTVQKFNTDGSSKYHFARIMRNSGDVVGERIWARVLETTPEAFYAAIEEKRSAKKAEGQERLNAWNVKVALVKARNSHIIITDEGMGLKKAIMVDSNNKPMMIFFNAQSEDYFKDYSQPAVQGVRIRATTWVRKDRRDDEYGFSSTDARGATIEDALIDLVAGHYWN
jgi:hypothetical protein